MNKKLKFSFGCLLFISLASGALAEQNLTKLVTKIQPAIVTIQTYDQNQEHLGLGTGFFITINTLITNYHVLRGAHQAEVITHDGMKYPIIRVMAENEKMDLVKILVDIPRDYRKSISHVNLSKSLPSIAENIIVIGSPFGLEQTVSEGIISSVRLVPKIGTLLQISAPISSGSSGSPVLNMKGEVVGIVSFFLLEGQNLNFAIPTEYISNLEPMGTLKTIPEWSEQETCRLYIHTEPEGARIRILNIKPKFFQGIPLEPGQYHIEVSYDGYKTKMIWIQIKPEEDENLRISLESSAHPLSEGQITTDSSHFFTKGINHEFMEEYEKAIEAYKECVRIDPDNRLCHMSMGQSYIKIKHYREASDVFKECIRIDPDTPSFHYYLGQSYFYLDLPRQAIEECKQAIELFHSDNYISFDDDETLHITYNTYILLGDSYVQLNHFTEAIEAFKKATEINPDCADAYANLAIVYGTFGRHYEAIEACKKVLRMQPDHLMTIMTLGAAYTNLGLHTEAIETQKQAVRIDPGNATAHFALGTAYLRSGDRNSALNQYKILKELDKEWANQLFNLIYE
jgi:tetratricopeptide (TPR) repeat protein